MSKKAVLIIMDGYGLAAPSEGNAIYVADTPNLDKLFARWPHTALQASGLDVGLPEGQMGNSEVGHTNMGAGRVVFQILPKMTQEIQNGKFFRNEVYIKAMEDAKANGKALHIMGLLSDGGVHSHLTHIFAILDMAKQRGVEQVFVHCFLDGRDVPPTSGSGFVKQLKEKCDSLGNARIATIQGRFWGMDRDKRWDRVEKGYNAIVCGEGVQDSDPVHAVEASYANNVTDEFVEPVVVCAEGAINEGDSVIFMNFRPRRRSSPSAMSAPRSMTRACPCPSPIRPRSSRTPSAIISASWVIGSSASRRPRSTPTSPSSSTAALRRRPRGRSAASSPRRRSLRPMTSSPR